MTHKILAVTTLVVLCATRAWAQDHSGNLQYADNPFFPYNPNLNNLSVPANGNYTITLDLHVSGKYTYKAVKT